ncbi:chromate transporter [Proteinivorax hydrogeniformans]|uniref:Chromate transporter n=1 Tax=Proteinivorax hydrogeniformans TaxID=1826727 RepID=A0AAU8HR75_9FIRM
MLFNLFTTFFRIGAFTFGGGYAMLPIIQREVVDNNGWISEDEYYEVLAVSQSGPGAVAINTAIYLGYRIKGVPGSIVGALGVVLPSFLIILAFATFLNFFLSWPVGEKFFSGIRPAVVGLLVSVTFKMMKKLTTKSQWVLFFICALLLLIFDLHPVYIILLSALYGASFSKKVLPQRSEGH